MERPIFLGPGFKEALPIADFQFPISRLRTAIYWLFKLAIGNRQSAIGNP